MQMQCAAVMNLLTKLIKKIGASKNEFSIKQREELC